VFILVCVWGSNSSTLKMSRYFPNFCFPKNSDQCCASFNGFKMMQDAVKIAIFFNHISSLFLLQTLTNITNHESQKEMQHKMQLLQTIKLFCKESKFEKQLITQ